jgi:hypothetical protein
LGHTRGKFSHVSVTSIVFGIGNSKGISHLLFEATNNTSHGFNKSINLFSGFELELDSRNQSSSIFSISYLEK